jgi:hypothetical protein
MLTISGRIAVKTKVIFVLLFLACWSLVGFAQDKPQKAKKPRVVNLSFEDELVRGANEEPSVETIFARDEFNFKKMIKIRQNFIPEVKQGSEVMNGK